MMPWRVRRDIEDFGFWQGIKYWTIYPIESWYHRYKERISRSWAFAKMAWLNYDFDAHTIWEILEFKLKRVLNVLENFAHLEQQDEDLLALKEAIAICGRLHADDYDMIRHAEHDKKWGELPDWTTKPSTFDAKGKVLTHEIIMGERPLVTPENKEQERKEFRESWEKAAEDRKADIDRLALLLKNHLQSWWD
jgi:hypothetical protein